MAAHLLTGKPQRFVLHAIDLLAVARDEAKALALQAAAASGRKSAAASTAAAAEEEEEAESVAAVDACWGRRPSVPAAAAAMVAGSGRSLLVQSRLLLPGSAPAAGAGALASARAAKGVLVARPASLAALHALARETFDWNDDEDEDERTSGETGSASVKALAPILVLLQEGVQASSASPSGQASWGGAIDTEEAFQLLRDGDVLEVVRYPVPLPATKPATAAAGRTSLAKTSGATHATGKRKRNGTVTGSGSSVSSTDGGRTAAVASAQVSSSPAPAAAAVVSPTTSVSAPPAVAATGAPSTVSVENAAAAAAAAAAMLLDSSPAMPPLEDAMGQLVQVKPSPPSGDGMAMHSGPNGVIQPIPVVPSSSSSASYTVAAGPTPAEEMALQQQLLQQHMLQHQQQMMMQHQAHAQQQALLAAHAKELNKQQYLVQAQAQVQAHQMHAQQMQAQMEAQRVQAILQAQMQQQQQEAQQAAIAQQQAAVLSAAMAARTTPTAVPRTPPSQQQSPRQAQQQSVPAITIAANSIIATSPISVATPASSSSTGAGTGTAAAQGSSSPSKSAGGTGGAAPAAPAAVGYLNFRRFTSSGAACPSGEPVSIKMKGAHKPMARFMAAYAQYKQEPLSSLTFLRPAAGGDHAALYSEARLKSDASLYTLPLRPTDTLASLGWDDFTPKYVMVRSEKDDTTTTTGSGK
jgi:hypothetical protein